MRREGGEGRITLLNVCRPQLGALSRRQRVAGWKSARGDSQAPASPPLSSVHLSPSPSNNPPGGTSLPPSTFFLPPLPSGGAGEVVWKGTPGRAGSGEYRCQILRQSCSFDFRTIKEEKNVVTPQTDIYPHDGLSYFIVSISALPPTVGITKHQKSKSKTVLQCGNLEQTPHDLQM